METVLLSIAAFAGTNIDDLFISMFFFAGASGKAEKRSIVIGKYAGILLLTFFSMLGACGLQLLSLRWLRLLGLFPIALGIREVIQHLRKMDIDEKTASSGKALWLSVTLITLANGADNIGVYIPLFAGFRLRQMITALIVFLAMNGLWCRIAGWLTELPALKNTLTRCRPILVPAVYLLLGFYILL